MDVLKLNGKGRLGESDIGNTVLFEKRLRSCDYSSRVVASMNCYDVFWTCFTVVSDLLNLLFLETEGGSTWLSTFWQKRFSQLASFPVSRVTSKTRSSCLSGWSDIFVDGSR